MPQTQTECPRIDAPSAYFAALIESAEDAIISSSVDGVIHTWNPAAERTFGYSAAEAVGRPASLLTPPEHAGEARTIIMCAARGEHVDPFQTQLMHKDGRRVDVSLAVSPIHDLGGNVIAVSQVARDIGTQRRAEHTLRESEARLRIIADSSPIIIWSTDAQGNLQFVNGAYRRFFGKGPEEIIGLDWRTLVHPDDAPAYVRAFERALEDRRAYDGIARVLRADGEWRWIESFVSPRFSPSGEFLGMVGSSPDITERKQADEALKRREEELRIITDSVPALIAYVDCGLRYRFVNLAYEKWFGEPREAMLGRHLRDVLGDGAYEIVRSHAERALRGEAVQFETWMDYRKGGRRYIHTSYLPRRDRDGKIEGFFVLVLDLTERKRAEEALRESEAREHARADVLDALMEHVPTGITIADADGTIRMVSRYGQKLTGRSRERLTDIGYAEHAPAWGIFRPDGALPAPHDLPLTRAIERGEVVRDEEWLIRRQDGEEIAVLTSAGPIRNGEGSIVGGVVAWHDISERKRSEEMLKRNEEALRRAQQIAHVGSYDYDIVADRVEWSVQLYEIFGLDPSTEQPSIAKALSQVHPDDRERVRAVLDKTLGGGPPFSIEARVLRPDGSERIVLGQGDITARDSAGRGTRLLGTVIDITERKRIEAEAIRAQKLESIGLLAGGIAHDFNNLLTAIFGNIQLAELNAQDRPGVIEPLQQAEKAFQAARSLTHQLLTFSRGGAPVRKIASVADLLRDSVAFALHGSSVEVEFQLPSDLWPASVDREQLGQVINNLAINAKDAMPTGGRLRVAGRNVMLGEANAYGLGAGPYVQTCLEDTGTGIAPEHLSLIFDPYFTTKPNGTGLGLPTVYSIIKRHGGHVTVESKPGSGARFCVYLPAARECVAETGRPGHAAAVRGNGRLLLMDDEPLLRDIGRALLERLGYQVTVAHDGEEAIGLFRLAKDEGRPFSAAILDLTVPGGMGGEACLRRLKEIDTGVRAIVSSGYSTDPVVAEYRAHGFVGVVPKPYRIEELGETLASIIPSDASYVSGT